MRRAYLGLSGPLAYDYNTETDKFHDSERSAPNPILEDSLGLLIFYDEIIFLSRHMCPLNMRELPYVKFLTDRKGFANIFNDVYSKAESQRKLEDERNSLFPTAWDTYSKVLCNITGQQMRVDVNSAKYIPDNHTHNIYLTDKVKTVASSTWFQNVLIDWITKEEFGLENCDVISNSGNQNIYSHLAYQNNQQHSRTAVVNHLIVNRLPNYLDKLGPYHECLEELRNHQFIEEMRSFIDDLIVDNNASELSSVAKMIEATALKYRDDIFQRHLAGSNEYWAVGKAAALDTAGLFVPGCGLVSEMIEVRKRMNERKEFRWTGFVCDLNKI